MENRTPRLNEGEVIDHCTRQFKKIRNLSRSCKLLAKNAKAQADKVVLLTNDTTKQISSELDALGCFDKNEANEARTVDDIVNLSDEIRGKLSDMVSQSADDYAKIKAEMAKSNQTSSGDKSFAQSQIPSLPSTSNYGKSYANGSDEGSDSESEYIPDQSSLDSCDSTSSCFFSDNKTSRSAPTRSALATAFHAYSGVSDDDDVRLSDDDLFDDDDDDDDVDFFNDSYASTPSKADDSRGPMLTSCSGSNFPAFSEFTDHPIPAAGQDSDQSDAPSAVAAVHLTQKASSESQPVCSHVADDTDMIKPLALRRVRSMTLNRTTASLGVYAFRDRRITVLRNNTRPGEVRLRPNSPLVAEEVTLLKKSRSFDGNDRNTYSLKRSASPGGSQTHTPPEHAVIAATPGVVATQSDEALLLPRSNCLLAQRE